ncbi:MAG: alpha/beta hydrolase [Pseudomonadota bacterium]
MPQPTEIEFRVFGRTIAAKRWHPGGIPTIALHGWLDNAASFDLLAPQLPGHDIIALDDAGHGRSAHLPRGQHYMPIVYLQDTLAIIEQLGWQRYVLIGHSMGATLVSELAGYFPKRVQAAVMIDGALSARDQPHERTQINRYALKQMIATESTPKRARVFESIEQIIDRVVATTEQSHASARLLVERATHAVDGGITWRTDPNIRMRTPLRLSQPEIDVLLGRSTSPALLVAASHVQAWRTEERQRYQALHPDLTVVDIDGPHHAHMEAAQADAVGSAVRAFLQARG